MTGLQIFNPKTSPSRKHLTLDANSVPWRFGLRTGHTLKFRCPDSKNPPSDHRPPSGTVRLF